MSGYSVMSEHDVRQLCADIAEARGIPQISVNKLAKEAGVSQPLARRAARGEVKVRTPNLSRLELYVHMKLGRTETADVRSLDQAVRGYLSAGGNVAELRRIIEVHATLRRAQG
jgi:hypothetical protein